MDVLCSARVEIDAAYFDVEPMPPTGADNDVDTRCTVLGVEPILGGEPSDPTFNIVLDCASETYAIDVNIRPAPDTLNLDEGDDVRLQLASRRVWWVNRAFAIRDIATGRPLLAGSLGNALPVPGGSFAAVDVEMFGGAVFDAVDLGCTFVESFCYSQARAGVRVETAGAARVLAAQTEDTVGDLRVWVGAAELHGEPLLCTDVPNEWYAFMVMSD